MTTLEIAEHMLETGKYYTASILSKELNIPLYNASGKLYNIKHGKKYSTVTSGTPVGVKVVDIQGVKKAQGLWEKLLSGSLG